MKNMSDIKEKYYDERFPHFVVGEREAGADYYERPGAYIVPISPDGKFGLIRTKGGYCFMGGGKEQGEDDIACLHREALEESGYKIEIGEYFASAEQFKPDQTDIGYFHPMQNYYTGKLLEKVCEPVEPDHFFEWVSFDEIKDRMPIKMQRLAIELIVNK